VAGNPARQWLAGDSVKPRIFMLCEKKHKSVAMGVRKEGKRAFSPSVFPLGLKPKTFGKS